MNARGFSFKDNIREIMIISFPMMVSQACDTVMIFTDRMFLSRLQPELMNAAMGGGLTVFMMLSFFIGLIGFSTALVAQYLGARKKGLCAKVVSQTSMVACAAYLIIILFGPGLGFWLFDHMGIPSGQIAAQRSYFLILLFGSFVSLSRIVISSFFSGIGRTRIVMAASLISMVVNIFLNYVFIFGKFGFSPMGIEGAAYGTVIGGAFGVLILVWGYFRKDICEEFGVLGAFSFDREIIWKFLRFGLPAGWELFFNMVAFNAVIMIFHSMGPVVATATTIMFNWDLVSFVPLLGIEIGVTSLVGRYMGAGDPQGAHRSVMAGLLLGCVYSLGIFLLFVGLPQQLIYCFRPNEVTDVFEQAVPLAVFMVRVASFYVVLEAMFLVMIGAFRGAGDTFWAMAISVTLHFLMALAAWFGFKVFAFSPEIVWISIVVLFLLCSLVVFLRYQNGSWRRIRLVDDPTLPPGNDFHEPADI